MELIIYNRIDICTRPAKVVRCKCGQRFAGTEAHLQVIDTEKETWTNISCPDCQKQE